MFAKRFARAALVTATTSLVLTAAAFAAVQTDKWLYEHGETVQITGDEMAPGEDVQVDVYLPPDVEGELGVLAQTHVVTADLNGEFSDTFFLDYWMPGGIYDVVATGLTSGALFTTQFDPATSSCLNGETPSASGETQTSLTINWFDDCSNENRFIIRYGTTSALGSSVTVSGIAGETNAASRTITGLTCGTTYFFSVEAQKDAPGAQNSTSNQGSGATSACTPSDTTPPTIVPTIVGTLGSNGWYTSNVTVSWTVNDTESAYTATGCGTTTITVDTSGQTITCSASSAGGPNSHSVTIKRDATNPSVTATPSPVANANGWNNSDVTVTYSGTDALSGVDFCDPADVLVAEGAGQSATGSCTDEAGNSASATASDINIDKTAPSASASASPAPNANGWNNTNVTVSFTGADGLSGIDFCDPAEVLSSEGAGQSASGTCTDEAGNVSDEATASGINIDKTAPTAVAIASPVANANGWWNTDVTVSFSGSDLLSGIDFCSADVVLSSEGAGQSASGTCTDKAGNISAQATAGGINIDKTAPSVSATPSPVANANDWNNSDVTVTYSGTDALSGIDSCDPADVLDTEGAGQSATGSCTDEAGNSASATAGGINIDKTAPTVGLVGGPANGGSYYFGSVPAAPTCAASDSLSGLQGTCSTSGYGTTVGTHTVVASATDMAGNSANASATYAVIAWETYGFYRPVDMGATMNTVKGGSTVPLKFEVFAGTSEFTSTSIVAGFRASEVPCTALSWMPADLIDITSTGGTSLRYDSTEGQFIQNWKVPTSKNKCYSTVATFLDGSSIQAYFMTK
jgi:hypothetical protein